MQDAQGIVVVGMTESAEQRGIIFGPNFPRVGPSVSPEGAGYNSPGQRPGTLVPRTQTQAPKGRAKR